MKEKLISDIVAIEWSMFSATQNIGGQASCQRDKRGFETMRASQFENWDSESLELYYADLLKAESQGLNLPTLKYAYMMEHTDPEGFKAMAHLLPPVDGEKKALVEALVGKTLSWCMDFARRWPHVAAAGRSISSSSDSLYNTSVETYSRGEFSTYGVATLRALLKHYEELEAQGINLHEKVVERELCAQGARSLEHAESIFACR